MYALTLALLQTTGPCKHRRKKSAFTLTLERRHRRLNWIPTSRCMHRPACPWKSMLQTAPQLSCSLYPPRKKTPQTPTSPSISSIHLSAHGLAFSYSPLPITQSLHYIIVHLVSGHRHVPYVSASLFSLLRLTLRLEHQLPKPPPCSQIGYTRSVVLSCDWRRSVTLTN